jgi:undecaprenol kinase
VTHRLYGEFKSQKGKAKSGNTFYDQIQFNNQFMKRFLLSFVYAFKGIAHGFSHEQNFRLMILYAVGVLSCGWFFGASLYGMLLIATCMGLLLTFELFNSALEKLCDIVHKERHPVIGTIKDLAAGAVLIFALVSLAVSIAVLTPAIDHYLNQPL